MSPAARELMIFLLETMRVNFPEKYAALVAEANKQKAQPKKKTKKKKG